MNNYKIRVNNEAESREAQELFFELGYAWHSGKHCLKLDSGCTHLTVYSDGALTMGSGDAKEELTLPQLRDLVVLHRNDYTDATHVDQDGWKWFISSDGKSYVFGAGNSQGLARWDESLTEYVDLTPMQKPKKIQEQGLISGADALRALAGGKGVEYSHEEEPYGRWTTISNFEEYSLDCFLAKNTKFKFRLKPRTITLNVEIPAPFEPKVGEEYYYPYPHSERGYALDVFKGGRITNQFGAWRTEAEIKIVVEQLRKIKEQSK